MKEIIMPEIMQKAPISYAYHKVVYNREGIPDDYIFLDVNSAFEEMTGLKKGTIAGKKAMEVLPGITNNSFDWTDFYGKIALCSEGQEFTGYMDFMSRCYKIIVSAPQKGYIIIFFLEITPEIERIKALEKQEQRNKELAAELEMVFNSTQDAMFLVRFENDEFRYIRNNAAHQKLAGYSLEDIRDKTPFEVTGEEIGKILISGYQRCVDTRSPITYEETLPFPAGVRTWLTTMTPAIENGVVKNLIGSRKDITIQKHAEEERKELFNRLQAMFNEHTAIMLLIEPVSGKIVDANPAACAFYGYTKEEILDIYIQDINVLSEEEVEKRRLIALREKQRYFLFPHRLKSGETKMVDVYSCPITHSGEKLLFSIIFDVSDREKYKEELYWEKELLKTALLSIGDGVVTTDEKGRVTVLNKVAEEITGWREEEARGRPFEEVFELISEDTGKKVEDPILKVLKTGKIIGLANHTILIAKDGHMKPIADSAAPIKNEKGHILGVIMVFRDVTSEKIWQKKILDLSYHDSLTGLHNRRFIEEHMKKLEASQDLPLAVIMADVNGLKLANDVFGHEEGDRLLKKAAGILKENCRKDDVISRWGGDEFLIILPKTTNEIAEGIIERIKNKCPEIKSIKTQLSIAMGYAVKREASERLDHVIKEAEERMYRQKLMEGKSYRNALVSTLLATLFAKSMETEEHAERLKSYCLAIGKEMGFSIKEQDELSLLAVLHDIGKVGINENILQKLGPLTTEEWEELKKHPEIGYRIAQNTPELSTIAEYILYHHERWDGQGYPRGLKAEEIPLLCRVLAVADAFDAMSSNRTYRKAISRMKAIEEIKRNSGSQFDPKVVKVFLQLYRKETPEVSDKKD
ncbi:putative diguanylate cyclase YegE [Oxobacter pfennigii]|uniref:Putative diguanylate cyclase YegE n=1 Tax=Oxobacter pfennigii TaxID=36849 RepID=A0A0P8WUG3_9CLOT|nr:PAS domain S-box protein [Oxobacter pfennigii]KPU46353.1 putative diguanylate cyclase YegE [Oxobacter pfennigii]